MIDVSCSIRDVVQMHCGSKQDLSGRDPVESRSSELLPV